MRSPVKKVLVTGAAGFIGSHVARYLADRGHQVVALDDLSGGYTANVPLKANFVKGSVTDTALLDRLFKKNHFEVVFHLAAYAAEGLSHFVRAFNYHNNVVGSMNLISRAIEYKCKTFVFTSSIAVYGASQLPASEDMTPRPEDPYGIGKYAVELDLEAMNRMFGINYVIFRPHNVYGEGQNIGDPFRNVVGIFMRQILAGEKLTIFGNGKQTRAFSHIDDVAPLIAKSAWNPKAKNRIFNIGANKPYSVNELAKAVCESMKVKPRIEYLPARHEVLHAYSDHRKIQKVFGPQKSVSLEEGIARMALWVKKTGFRKSRVLPPVEVWEKLPVGWEKVLLKAGQRKKNK